MPAASLQVPGSHTQLVQTTGKIYDISMTVESSTGKGWPPVKQQKAYGVRWDHEWRGLIITELAGS